MHTQQIELPQTEYARLRGVAVSRIRENVAAGRLKAIRKGKAVVINVAEADAVLKPRGLAEALAAAELAAAAEPGPVAEPAPEAEVVEAISATALAADPGLQQVVGLTKARTVREEYRARLERLQYETRIGRVVEVAAVTRAMERAGHVLVREMERIPLAAEDIAAAFTTGGVVAVRAALRKVVRDLRQSVSDNLRLIDKTESTGDDLG